MTSEQIFQAAGSGRFARELLNLLTDETVIAFQSVVAFATLDGVLLLGPEPEGSLYKFLSRGGAVDLVIGSDRVTTDDALNALLNLSRLFPDTFRLRVFSSQDHSLFHPKLYLFEKIDGSAVVLSGSNNLTRGGLFSNTEYAVREEITASDYLARKEIFDTIAATPGAVGEVTDILLSNLRQQRQAEVKAIRTSKALGNVIATADSDLETRVVILMVAGGGRWSQVSFRADTMLDFFGLDPTHTGPVWLQQMQPGQVLRPLEERHLIRPPKNQNSRLEFGGFSNMQYPTLGQRPILIAEEMGHDLFRYLCLMPGDSGHAVLEQYLRTLPTRHRAMPQEITTVDKILELWPDYPS